MIDQYPILTLLAPFFFAFFVSFAGLFNSKYCYPLALLATGLSFAASIGLLCDVNSSAEGLVRYKLGGWPPPIGIEYVIDPLNAVVLVMITLVTFLVTIYSRQNVPKETPGREAHYYTLFLLLEVGLLGMTITGDAFNLYVFLEISSLASYALIAMGPGRAALSCFNYIIMGTIGASFYLLGVGYLYIKTGSLNMGDITLIMQQQDLYDAKTIKIGFLFILIGVWIKMAFYPLHRWLPGAYSYAPTTTSCLVAPLMTKVSIYVMIRYMYTVFTPEFTFASDLRADLIVWLAVAAILVGSFYALARRKIRKMLSFLIVSEVGYMVGGAWLASEIGLTGTIYHILADGLMTLCLFLFAGIVIRHKTTTGSINALTGLFSRMPLTMAGFVVGAFSMIGIPPTAGFYSKWNLISGGFEAGHYQYVAALLISSLVNAVLFFKIIEKAFFEPARGCKSDGEAPYEKRFDEAPPSMLIPLLGSAVLIILLGVFSSPVLDFIRRFVEGAV